MIGTRLGHFRIVERLGEGGMGEVWRARDEHLGRDVAIKVLPSHLAADPDRLSRLQGEARALAALNHQNVGAIYGIETAAGTAFLVLELVEGETLASRLSRGRLPVAEALKLCAQVAAGLEAAHEARIVHRDLKPGNVILTPRGTAKVVDLGLATGSEPGSVPYDQPTEAATDWYQRTAEGMVVGTVGYMSPEQARGERVDSRTDIWAFGCVLCECLTGRRTFAGSSAAEVFAAVLESEPDWRSLPERTPPRVRELLQRCLAKDPSQRLRHAGDVRLELEAALAEPAKPARTTQPSRWGGRAAWALAGGLLALAAYGLVTTIAGHGPAAPRGSVVRLSMPLPDDAPMAVSERSALAVSRDGSRVVYVAGSRDHPRLYLRELSAPDAVPIPETDGASNPLFSLDGGSVWFFTVDALMKVSVSGGAAQRVSSAPPVTMGATWLADGGIAFTPNRIAGLARPADIPSEVEWLTKPDLAEGDGGHCWPEALPDGSAVLVTVLPPQATSFDDARIEVIDLDTHKRSVLVEGGSYCRFAPPAHLVFARRGSLYAVPFDADRVHVTGTPVEVVKGVLSDPTSGVAQYALSSTGTLVYAPGDHAATERRSLVWVDRNGESRLVTERHAAYSWPRPSPDGRSVLVSIEGATDDLWLLDLQRQVFRRLTFQGRNIMPLWAPDGRTITYSSVRGSGYPAIYSLPVNGSGEPELLVASENAPLFPTSWSPDGKTLAYVAGGDIYVLPEGGSPQPFEATRFAEGGGVFSPDGHWIAYVSAESGRMEVYVKHYPDTGAKWQVSTDGGLVPLWSPDGREIFFRNGDTMYAASVAYRPEPRLTIGRPRLLFRTQFAAARPHFADHALSADGREFLIVKEDAVLAGPTELTVVFNWFDELNRDASAGGG